MTSTRSTLLKMALMAIAQSPGFSRKARAASQHQDSPRKVSARQAKRQAKQARRDAKQNAALAAKGDGVMCDYQGYEFGAGSYPDSLCVDGLLHDADSDYANDEKTPCPICDREAAIQWWFERWKDSTDSLDDNRPWETINAEHLARATALVDDIRKNRGIEPPTQKESTLTDIERQALELYDRISQAIAQDGNEETKKECVRHIAAALSQAQKPTETTVEAGDSAWTPPHWKVGRFRVSNDPESFVLCLGVGAAIRDYEAHYSFVEWIHSSQ